MDWESDFTDVVLFEVPAAHADEFSLRLKPRLTWLHLADDGDLFVAAALGSELDDLARLLRDAQAWISDSDVPYVMFLLDGRKYELRAPADALSGRPA